MKKSIKYKVKDTVAYMQYFGLTLMKTIGVIIEVDGDGRYIAIKNQSGAIHYTGKGKIIKKVEFAIY